MACVAANAIGDATDSLHSVRSAAAQHGYGGEWRWSTLRDGAGFPASGGGQRSGAAQIMVKSANFPPASFIVFFLDCVFPLSDFSIFPIVSLTFSPLILNRTASRQPTLRRVSGGSLRRLATHVRSDRRWVWWCWLRLICFASLPLPRVFFTGY
nr:hypothetical protein Itr_chr12CG14380 [Ipomoea trifida]